MEAEAADEFKASMVSTVKVQARQGYIEGLCLNNKHTTHLPLLNKHLSSTSTVQSEGQLVIMGLDKLYHAMACPLLQVVWKSLE